MRSHVSLAIGHRAQSRSERRTPGTLIVRRLLLIACVLFSTGCGTLLHGTTQRVGISSNPVNARVTVDGIPLGRTPVFVVLARKRSHQVRIEMDRYEPIVLTLKRTTSEWAFGNVLLGIGIVPGFAIDAVSGGLYKLTPEQLQGALARQGASVAPTNDGIHIVLVQSPEAGWLKVGQLAPTRSSTTAGE